MAYRQRTSKLIARRHDLNHFKYTPGLRKVQLYTTLAVLVLVVAGLALATRHSARLFAAGPISTPHAQFAHDCAACHTSMGGMESAMRKAGFRRHATDAACLHCHVAPAHLSGTAVEAKFTPACSSCHVEHVGSTHLAQVSDQNCVQCHADLSAQSGSVTVAAHIHSFTSGHPEFRAVRDGSGNDEHILFNHAAHLQAGLRGPDGSAAVTMQCGDCHKTFAVAGGGAAWAYGRAARADDEISVLATQPVSAALHRDGEEYMAPVTFQQSCRACHNLQFDFFTRAEAPHAGAAAVHAFVAQEIRTFAAQNPAAVSEDIRLLSLSQPTTVPGHSGQPLAPPKNSAQWVDWRIRYSEAVLAKKCALCHESHGTFAPPAESGFSAAAVLPLTVPTQQPVRYMRDAVFSHGAHSSYTCESCHIKARGSVEPSDVLLPGIASCQKCHNGPPQAQNTPVAAGHAQSGCFLCHSYHSWDTWHGDQPPSSTPRLIAQLKPAE